MTGRMPSQMVEIELESKSINKKKNLLELIRLKKGEWREDLWLCFFLSGQKLIALKKKCEYLEIRPLFSCG